MLVVPREASRVPEGEPKAQAGRRRDSAGANPRNVDGRDTKSGRQLGLKEYPTGPELPRRLVAVHSSVLEDKRQGRCHRMSDGIMDEYSLDVRT